jgi:NNP family nitrate/nitrite transporter-like MFS transporter
MERTASHLPESERRLEADRQSAAIIGFISAIAGYGAFYIPKAYGLSIQSTGSAEAALWSFLVFYLSCAIFTWLRYSGPHGTLREQERSASKEALAEAISDKGLHVQGSNR